MWFVTKTLLSLAAAIAAVVAIATFGSALADVLAGIVALVAILVFTRATMGFAAEPGEESQR